MAEEDERMGGEEEEEKVAMETRGQNDNQMTDFFQEKSGKRDSENEDVQSSLFRADEYDYGSFRIGLVILFWSKRTKSDENILRDALFLLRVHSSLIL